MSQTLSAPAKHLRRAAWASWIGSALEYYDFAVYGTAAAVVLNHIFFPGDSPAVATLKSMVAVGVAYVVRPLGAMIMGPLGDRFGRKFVLMLTLFMIGFAVSGGVAPAAATALSGEDLTGWVGPASFVVLVGLLVALVASRVRETAHLPLAEIDR